MREPIRPKRRTHDPLVVVAVLVAVGLAAAMGWAGWRAFGHSAASQDNAILGNLRNLQAAADQYFLANGVSSVASVTIVGTNSSQYFPTLYIVAQETYPARIVQGQGISAAGVAGARTVTFGP